MKAPRVYTCAPLVLYPVGSRATWQGLTGTVIRIPAMGIRTVQVPDSLVTFTVGLSELRN